jgi:hypothetical protein
VVVLGNKEENHMGSPKGQNLPRPTEKLQLLDYFQYKLVSFLAPKVLI